VYENAGSPEIPRCMLQGVFCNEMDASRGLKVCKGMRKQGWALMLACSEVLAVDNGILLWNVRLVLDNDIDRPQRRVRDI
jgi:hypothetical protein